MDTKATSDVRNCLMLKNGGARKTVAVDEKQKG